VSSRQIALIKLLEEQNEDGASTGSVLDAIPLGTYEQVVESLSHYNIASDGSPDSFGVLYGPGFSVQLPFVGATDPVMQVLIGLDEESIAWPVLSRICQRLQWKMLDPSSGRTFG